MAMDRPHLNELIEAVREFLGNDIAPKLSGYDAFQLRIACNVLDIAQREVEKLPTASTAERARLQDLLKTGEDDLDQLNRSLCAAIRDGSLDGEDPQLIEHLWATTLDKVAIDQPRYATYRQEAEKRGHSL